VHEVVYPPHADWKEMISIAEHVDEHTLNVLTPKYVQLLSLTSTLLESYI
jgi:hypothetical protein